MTDVARLRPELLAARPEVPAPDRQLESWQRLRFFESLAQAFRAAAPLVMVTVILSPFFTVSVSGSKLGLP